MAVRDRRLPELALFALAAVLHTWPLASAPGTWARVDNADTALNTWAIAWVGICIGAGYLFGNVPVVRDNFSLVAIGIVLVSVLPMVLEFIRYRRETTSPIQPK